MIRAATSCAVAAVLALSCLVVPTAAAQEDLTAGLRVDARQFVEVDLDESVLRVRHEIELRNELPTRTSGGIVERFYFASFTLPVYRGASEVAAVQGDGRELPVSITDDPNGIVSYAAVDLRPDLYFDQTTSFVLTYELRTQPPRTGGLAQINAALATFPLVLSGDPGLSDVEVRIPSSEEVEVVGDTLTRSIDGDWSVLSATDVADPVAWFATVLVRDDDQLVQREVELPPHTVTLQGWPGDDEWMTTTSDLAERGLPALEQVIGYGWDRPRQIDIVETTAPYVYGFAGWYQGSGTEATIEVGDMLDPHVTLHELAHSWFDATAFEGRWLNEALADETAALAMEDLGLGRPVPEPPSIDTPGALPLLTWEDPELADPESDEQEAYGYDASWWIAHQLTEEIGEEGLRDVLVAAHEGRTAYDDDPLTGPGSIDWREMLDLVEDVGGSDDAVALWRTFVLTPEQIMELETREAARVEYERLVSAGDGWLPPRALRDEMARWDFDAAADTGGQLFDLLDRRDELADSAGSLDVELPSALETTFEEAETLDVIDAEFDEVDAAVSAVLEAEAQVDSLGAFGQIGLWLEDPSRQIDDAVTDLEVGAWTQAERHAQQAVRDVERAEAEGVARVVGLGGLVLLAGYGTWRWANHHRRARAT